MTIVSESKLQSVVTFPLALSAFRGCLGCVVEVFSEVVRAERLLFVLLALKVKIINYEHFQ